MCKRILIVSGSFYPTNSPRSYRTVELSLEFARKGYLVTTLVPDRGYNYSNERKLDEIEILTFQHKKSKKSPSTRKRLVQRFFERFMKLCFEYPDILMSFKLNKVMQSLGTKYDVIISIASPYPIHWGVALALRKKSELADTWIADCGDPYMGCNINANIFNKHPFYFKWIEKWMFNKVDFITVPIKEAISAYYVEFHSKIVVIPQGFAFAEDKESVKFVKNDPIKFCYAGLFYKTLRDPRPFLNYLSTLKMEFRFIIYTNSNGRDLIKPYKNRLKDKLVINDLISRDDLLEVLKTMDFVVNLKNESTSQSPSKLIDYSLAGRPILSISANEPNINIINGFMNHNYKSQMIIPDIKKYHISNVVNDFINLFSKINK